MPFNRVLEEYQDGNKKRKGSQFSAILMFGAEEPCTVFMCVGAAIKVCNVMRSKS